jgi:hypothetical protein
MREDVCAKVLQEDGIYAVRTTGEIGLMKLLQRAKVLQVLPPNISIPV